MENSTAVSQHLKTELAFDPVIPLLGIHPKEMKSMYPTDICTAMFTAAQSTIAQR
jgi:hypothetical protein